MKKALALSLLSVLALSACGERSKLPAKAKASASTATQKQQSDECDNGLAFDNQRAMAPYLFMAKVVNVATQSKLQQFEVFVRDAADNRAWIEWQDLNAPNSGKVVCKKIADGQNIAWNFSAPDLLANHFASGVLQFGLGIHKNAGEEVVTDLTLTPNFLQKTDLNNSEYLYFQGVDAVAYQTTNVLSAAQFDLHDGLYEVNIAIRKNDAQGQFLRDEFYRLRYKNLGF